MTRQEMSPFILYIGEHPLIYYTLFINELKGGTLGNVPIILGNVPIIHYLASFFMGKILIRFRNPSPMLSVVVPET